MSIKRYSSRFFHWVVWMFCMGLLGCSAGTGPDHNPAAPKAVGVQQFDSTDTIYSFKLKDIDGWPIALSRYEGKVLLVVNVASECRFTHQYANLQRLYMKYRDRGFVVLGFPANNFGKQEPGTNAQIKEFVTGQYNILFPLFSKISVKGEDTHPLYQHLKREARGFLRSEPIKWNFTKFLVNRGGEVVKRYGSTTKPEQIEADIEAALD